MIYLCEIKIFINNGIYKSSINFSQINVILKPSIIFSAFFQSLYKTFVSSSKIYYNTLIIQLLIPDMFIKVYIIIQDKKTKKLDFFYNLFHDNLGVNLQPMSNRLI